MISPSSKDTNRSLDVEGPELKRPKDEDLKMAEHMLNDTGMISKHPIDSLHQGNIEAPLKALGAQEVVVKHPMGSDSSAKQSGTRQSLPKGVGRSIAGKMEAAVKAKSKY